MHYSVEEAYSGGERGLFTHPLELNRSAVRARINNRKSIFLDTNIWIDLRDERGSEARNVKDLLTRLVNEEKIFCPLSFALISELFKQTHESAITTAGLMDNLSLNTCFARNKEVYHKEIDDFVTSYIEKKSPGLPREDVYVPVIAYLSSDTGLTFPEGFPATEDEKADFAEELTKKLVGLKVTDLVSLLKEFLPIQTDQFNSILEYSETWKERWDFTKGDIKLIRRIEEEHALQHILIPRIKETAAKLSFELHKEFADYINSLPTDEYGGASEVVIESLPAFRNYINIMTVSGLVTSKKGNMHDFFDIEMMIMPLAYCDAFVSRDKWINYILTTHRTFLAKNRATHVATLEAFKSYLESL